MDLTLCKNLYRVKHFVGPGNMREVVPRGLWGPTGLFQGRKSYERLQNVWRDFIFEFITTLNVSMSFNSWLVVKDLSL